MAARGSTSGQMPLPENRRTLWQAFCEWFGRVALPAVTRVRVEGLENVPTEGSLILASNHCSYTDGLFIVCWIRPKLQRPIHLLAKEEAMQQPFVGWFLRSQTGFGIRRSATDIEAFRVASRILNDGNRVLGGFPEGTRSVDGLLQEGRDGITMMALKTGASILPIGITGTERLWPKGKRPRLGGHVTMRIGKPFSLQEVLAQAEAEAATAAEATAPAMAQADSADEAPEAEAPKKGRTSGSRRNLEAGTREIMLRIAVLLPEWQRGFYREAAKERIEQELARRAATGGGDSAPVR